MLIDVKRRQWPSVDENWRLLTTIDDDWRQMTKDKIDACVNYCQKNISNFLIFQNCQKTSNIVMKCGVTSKASKNVITDASSQWRHLTLIVKNWQKLTRWQKMSKSRWQSLSFVILRHILSIGISCVIWRLITSIYAWRFQHYLFTI